MDKLQARVGDAVSGIYYSPDGPVHCNGTIVTGEVDKFSNGEQLATVGSTVHLECGFDAEVQQGSSTVKVNGKQASRLGDLVLGPRFVGHISSVSQTKTTTKD